MKLLWRVHIEQRQSLRNKTQKTHRNKVGGGMHDYKTEIELLWQLNERL